MINTMLIQQKLKKYFPFFVAVPALVWQVLFLYIPLFCMLSNSFFKATVAGTEAGLTLDNFYAIADAVHGKIIGKSLLIGFIVACSCLLIGYPVAYFFAVKMRRFKTFFLFFLTLPFWTNFLVQAYAWFFVLEQHGFLNRFLMALGLIAQPLHILNTQVAVVLVMIYCYLPFMILPLFGVLEKFDTRLLEASLDLGASPLRTFFKVTLPLTGPAIANGFFLVFVPACGEYAIPAIMGGGKYLYVGNLIAAYFLQARNPSLGAAFTAVSGFIILLMVLLLQKIAVGSIKKEFYARQGFAHD